MDLRLPLRVVISRPRLFVCVALAIAAGLAQPQSWRLTTRLLLAWDFGALVYFVVALSTLLNAPHASMRRRAAQQDDGRIAILLLTSFAALAAIGAIVAELAAVKDLSGTAKHLHIALAALTIISAWLFIHLMFALHYAHDFYASADSVDGGAGNDRGGLTFPETDAPDYWDFLYFSYVIGVACQTADVAISSRAMRRTALFHCVLAFFFNSAVLALTINIAAGLI